MTDDRANELIAAVRELTAAIINQNQKQPPNLFRKLEEFPGFDWEHEIPGCQIIAQDKNGPTEVSYENRVYRRYRSPEDDSKGMDIRFRCVLSGTVAQQNMKWGTLIKFGEPKAVKPLNAAIREKIAERAAANPLPIQQKPAAPSQPAAGVLAIPVVPPVQKPTAQPSPAGIATPPLTKSLTPDEDNWFLRWTKAADVWRANKQASIPEHYSLEYGLPDVEIKRRVLAFEEAAGSTSEQLGAKAEAKRADAAARLKVVVDEAERIGCELANSFTQAWPSQDAANIELTISTVEALIKAHKSKYPNGKPPLSPVIDLRLECRAIGSRQEAAFKNKFRIGANDRTHVCLALNDVAGGDDGRHAVIKWATDGRVESQKDLSDDWVYAFFNWLKPHKNGDGKWHVAPNAEKTIAQIIASKQEND